MKRCIPPGNTDGICYGNGVRHLMLAGYRVRLFDYLLFSEFDGNGMFAKYFAPGLYT